MMPETDKISFVRTKTANNLADLAEGFSQTLQSPTMRLIEEVLLDQSTRLRSTRSISLDQLQQTLSQHLTDTTIDDLTVALLSGYLVGHAQPFDTLCTLLLHMAEPLIQRTPPPAISQVTWCASLVEKLMEPYGSSMERAKNLLIFLQEEIAPQNTREDHDCQLFSECDAFFANLAPLLPNNGFEIASIAFARWLMSTKHTNDEINAGYCLLSCFFTRLNLYDLLKNLLPACRLESHELGLILTSLWSKQALESATGVKILQTFDKLLYQLEKESKLALFKQEMIRFYSHISCIPLIKKQTCSQYAYNVQLIGDLAISISKRLG